MLPLEIVLTYARSAISLIAGAIVTAFFGALMAGRLSNEQLERAILVLLVLIGVALTIESFLPQTIPALLPSALIWRITAGIRPPA
ncbi:MAG TPA: hypothetical protein V6C90_14150 [Coleofasciculaceae cyanobacterium]|jgi:uncharacterized membrane protein YfcA